MTKTLGRMTVYDAHAHISLKEDDCSYYSKHNIDALIKNMDDCGISKSVVMLNPAITRLLCRNNLNHRVKVSDGDRDGELKILCNDCSNIIYSGFDPLRRYNEILLESVYKYKDRLIPFVYLNLANTTIGSEVNYFERKFSEAYFGYKLHPSFSGRSIDEILFIPSKKPLIVHTGVNKVDHPMNVINFSKRYEGNIIMAHFGRFSYEALKSVSLGKRLFVDSSPSLLAFNTFLNSPDKMFNFQFSKELGAAQDLYYECLDVVGEDKLIFGSDVPWGNTRDELQVIQMLKIPTRVRNKIAYKNLSRVIEID